MTAIAFRPPAPHPREKPLGLLGRLATLRRNPIEIWTKVHYEVPVMVSKTALGDRAVVSDPMGVRRVFLDNVANYRKDDFQLRVMRPGLGLLTAEARIGARSAARWRPCSHRVRSPLSPTR